MRALAIAVLILLLPASRQPASAWHDPGHMLMARLVYEHLNPDVRAQWTTILKAHPRYKEDLLAGMPDGFADPDLYAWMKAGTWPDLIRDRQHPMNAAYQHSNWHYVNYPFIPDATDRAQLKPPEPVDQGGEVDNILKALTLNLERLKDEKLAAPDRAVALCWMLHLVADLHQPMHATTLFSQRYPEGDRGGNEFLIKDKGEVQRLHIYWDLLFGTNVSPDAISVWRTVIGDRTSCRREALTDDLKMTTFRQWADESHALGVSMAYQNGALTGAVRKTYEADPATPVPPLPPAYEETARAVACQRIALAAYRLTDLLSK